MELTGLQNPMVKAAAELKQKKYRQQQGLFLAEGLRTVEEAVRYGAVQSIFYTAIEDDRTRAVLEEAAAKQIKLVCVSDKVLKKLPIPKRRRELLLCAKCAASVWMIFWPLARCCWFWIV